MNIKAVRAKFTLRSGSANQAQEFYDMNRRLRSGVAVVLLLSSLWAGSAFAVDNTEAGYVGTATGNWSGGGAGVVGVPDGSCANMGATGKPNYISNFGFSVPGGATITGLTAFTKRGSANDEMVTFQLADDVTAPSFIGTVQNQNITGAGGGSCATTVAGQFPATANNNLTDWGLMSLTPAQVNSANFGIGLTTASQGTVKFDSVCLQVYYTTAEGPAVTEECLTAPPAGANLQVVKTVVGTPPGTDWSFNITGPDALNQNFTLDAAGSSEPFANITAGSYTITETTKAGYSVSAACFIDEVPVADSNPADNIVTIDIGDDENVGCAFVNTLDSTTFTVNKDFSDDSTDEVTINLVCESGTVVESDVSASEGSPAVFTVNGAAGTPNCTATETNVPAGYTGDDGCVDVQLSAGSCTITNTLNTASFTVNKDFVPDNGATVSISLTCDSGTVTESPLDATESSPAVFEVTGYTGDPDCDASEALAPTGHDADFNDCTDVALVADGECTITNTITQTPFTVTKSYSDGTTTDPVTINLTCTSGTVETNDLAASPGSPAEFNILGADPLAVPTCTATESGGPTGFTADESGCFEVALATGTCGIVNNVNTGTFTVRKIYSDDEVAPVSVTATCDAPAVVTNNPQMASPSTSAIFDVDYVTDGVTTCTATEAVPAGYEADEADCQDGDPINGGCAITNTPIARAEIQVLKDFTDDNPGEVHVELDCNTGLILDQEKDISEDGIGVTFVVTDFTLGSLACNVKEVPVPNGYLADFEASGDDPATDSDDGEDGCYWADISGGSFNTCLITNTPDEVDVVITKEWLYPSLSDQSGLSEEFSIVLQCENATIDGGQPGYCGILSLVEGVSIINSSCKVLYGEGDATLTTGVTPGQFPGGICYAYEANVADIVEVDNGCESPMQISAGQGGSCTITNTVFYEGIPTLNQYGMALLALLMLGVGMVGFRRFS